MFCLIFLSGLYPAVFLASKNWHMFEGNQLITLVILTPTIVILLGFIYYGLCYVFLKVLARFFLARQITIPERPIRRVLGIIFAILVILILLKTTIFAQSENTLLLIVFLLIALIGFAALGFAQAGVLVINVILLAMLTISSLTWANAYFQFKKNKAYTSWYTVNKDLNDEITFLKKPNVYLIHMESYHGQQAMKEIYGFDNQAFLDSLADRGFTAYPNSFSNYSNTMFSVSAMLSMQHHWGQPAAGFMDGLGLRDMIGGKTYCAVLRVFVNNGYKCQIVHKHDYVYNAGDDWQFVYPRPTLAKVFKIYKISKLNSILARLLETYGGRYIPAENIESMIDRRVHTAAKSTEPYFSFLNPPFTTHSPNKSNWSELASFVKVYQERIQNANLRFLKLFDLIIERDPEAIIVLYGDHGAMRYRGITKGQEELNKTFEDREVKGSTVALDKFSVIQALRFPGGDPSQLEGTSLVNLFRILFSMLSKDEAILDTMVANESYFLVREKKELYIAVSEGKPLDVWEKFSRR